MKNYPVSYFFLQISFLLLICGNLKGNVERDNLLHELDKHKKDDTLKVNLLLDIVWNSTYDVEIMYPYTISALELSEKLNYPSGIVTSKIFLAEILISQEKLDSAQFITNELKTYSEEHNDKNGKYYAMVLQMKINTNKGNYENDEYFEKIKAECLNFDDNYLYIYSHCLMTTIYIESGKSDKAKEIFNSVKPLLENFKGPLTRYFVLLYNAGRATAYYLKDFKCSIYLINKIIEITKQLGFPSSFF